MWLRDILLGGSASRAPRGDNDAEPGAWPGPYGPIRDPFGAGLAELDKTIAKARRTKDCKSLLSLYRHCFAHVRRNYEVTEGWVEVAHGNIISYDNQEEHRLHQAKHVLEARWMDLEADLTECRDDRRRSAMIVAIDEREVRLQFDEDYRNAPVRWRFDFVARAPPAQEP